MAIQQNQKRIRTTHIGSLPRPRVVLDLLRPKLNGQPYDEKVLDATVAQAAADQMKKQVECRIEIVSDGQMSKAGFFHLYLRTPRSFRIMAERKGRALSEGSLCFPILR